MVNGKRIAKELNSWMNNISASIEVELRRNADLYNGDKEMSTLVMNVRDAAIKVIAAANARLEKK